MPFPTLTPERAAAALAAVGIDVDAGRLVVEPRAERALVRLPGDRVAWFATSDAGVARLPCDGVGRACYAGGMVMDALARKAA